MTRRSVFDFPRPSGYDINKVFDCGQCFRFERNEAGGFAGTAYGKIINVSQTEDTVCVSGFDDPVAAVRYLGLDIDYCAIKDDLLGRFPDCPAMAEAISFSDGVAILRQEPWETLISFIISQNNNIPRIKGLIKTLSERCGTMISDGCYAFPTPEQVAEIGAGSLSTMKFGYRAEYIEKAAVDVLSGKADLEHARELGTEELLKFLTGFYGVGPKVASCVALFAYSRFDAFPVDVWIKRALDDLFPGHTAKDFGPYGGIAQQYLFYMQTHMSV